MNSAWTDVWPYLLTTFLTGIAVGLGIVTVKLAKGPGRIQL